jgi:D-apiose dehydrogenase
MMKKIRVGLVGCGYIAPTHLLAWEKVQNVEVVAVCDVSLEHAQQLAAHFEIAKVYQDYGEMFRHEPLDIADIAVPLEFHAEIATAAAQHGQHVLCQKPMARSMKDAEAIVAACRVAGVKLMVHQNFRFQPFSQHLKKMIDAGALGNVFYCRIFHRVLFSPEALPVAERDGKRPVLQHQPSYVGDDRLVLLHMVIHHLDTARYLLGEPARLYANTLRLNDNKPGENHAVILLEYADKVCYIEESWVTRGDELIGFRLEGDKGSVEILNERFRYYKSDGSCEESTLSAMFPGYSMQTLDNYSFRLVQQHFVDCVVNNQIPMTSGEDNLKTLALVLKGYESAENHQAIRLG